MFKPNIFTAAFCCVPLLAGCTASSKTFYESPTKVKDTQLCRTYLDAEKTGNVQFALDTATEAVRRGLTLEKCNSLVSTEDGVLIFAALAVTAVGVAAACSNGCGGGGGRYANKATDYDCWGGPGDGPLYVRGPVQVGYDDPYDLDRDNDGIGCEAGDFGA